jgi:hypothetical protein
LGITIDISTVLYLTAFLEQKIMEFITALMNTDPAHLVIGAFFILALFGMAGGETQTEDDNSDYEDATWNPASVNYKD